MADISWTLLGGSERPLGPGLPTYMSHPPCTKGYPGDALLWQWQRDKRAHTIRQEHFKLLLMKLLTSHWPKQITWPAQTQRVVKCIFSMDVTEEEVNNFLMTIKCSQAELQANAFQE